MSNAPSTHYGNLLKMEKFEALEELKKPIYKDGDRLFYEMGCTEFTREIHLKCK